MHDMRGSCLHFHYIILCGLYTTTYAEAWKKKILKYLRKSQAYAENKWGLICLGSQHHFL